MYLLTIEVVNMIREVHPHLACLLAVNGQNTLVHLARSIIIIVSVKCHSGRNLGSGTQEEPHPKIPHTLQETVSLHIFLNFFN